MGSPEALGVPGPAAERRLRRDCRRLLRRLELTAPLSPEDLCARLGEARGRPIDLRSRPMPVGLSGLLMARGEDDLIVVQSATTPVHRAHIIYHEVVHLIRGHLDAGPLRCGPLPVAEQDPGAAGLDRLEWEAECGATILTQWSDEPIGPAAPGSAPRSLRSALGGRPEWR